MRRSLLLTTNLILFLSFICVSLKASPQLPEVKEESQTLQPRQSNGSQLTYDPILVQPLSAASLTLQQDNSKDRKRKREEKVKKTSEALDTFSSPSSPTSSVPSASSTQPQEAEEPFSPHRVIRALADQLFSQTQRQTRQFFVRQYSGLRQQMKSYASFDELFNEQIEIHAALPAQEQDEFLQSTFEQLIGFISQGNLDHDFFNELIDSCTAALPKRKQHETPQSFNMRVPLVGLFKDMVKTLDREFHLRVFINAYDANTAASLHSAQLKLLQFYVRTLSPVRKIFKSWEAFCSHLSPDVRRDTRSEFEKNIFDLSIKLRNLISVSKEFCGEKATAEDYQLFGQAYDTVIKVSSYITLEPNEGRKNYHLKALEMYSKMLELLEEKATPEHFKLIACTYDNLGRHEEVIRGYNSLSKAAEYYKKGGKYYSKMIESLGTEATVKHYNKAIHFFYCAGSCLKTKSLEESDKDSKETAVREAANCYLKSIPFCSRILQNRSSPDSTWLISNESIIYLRTAASFLREHGYQEKADQCDAFLAEMKSKLIEAYSRESMPTMSTGFSQ